MVSEALTGKIRKSGAILMARGWNPLKPSYFFTFDKAQLIFFFFLLLLLLLMSYLRSHCLAQNHGNLLHQVEW